MSDDLEQGNQMSKTEAFQSFLFLRCEKKETFGFSNAVNPFLHGLKSYNSWKDALKGLPRRPAQIQKHLILVMMMYNAWMF